MINFISCYRRFFFFFWVLDFDWVFRPRRGGIREDAESSTIIVFMKVTPEVEEIWTARSSHTHTHILVEQSSVLSRLGQTQIQLNFGLDLVILRLNRNKLSEDTLMSVFCLLNVGIFLIWTPPIPCCCGNKYFCYHILNIPRSLSQIWI